MSAAPDPLSSALLQIVTEALTPTGEDAKWPWRPVGSSTSGGFDLWNPATWDQSKYDQVWQASRKLFSHCEFAIGGAVTRKNYIVGQGFKYEVVPRDDKQSVDPGVLAEFNRFVDAFKELNNLSAIESESQWRVDRDGNALIRLFDDDIPAVRYVEMSRLREPTADQARAYTASADDPSGPPDPATVDSSLGVCTLKRDVQTVKGYWVSPEPNAPPEWVPEAEAVHIKQGDDSACKLGLPVYYPVFENLKRAEDTLQSMGTMAKARAKIALVEYVQNLTASAAESQKARLTTGYQTMPDGTARQTTIEEIPFGARLRVPASSKLEFPSANVGASDLVGVLQADLRAVSKLLDMPEWMFTGLADQKYSNAFVVEAPTLKAFLSAQGKLVQAFGEGRWKQRASLVWRAIKMACERGVLPLTALPLLRVKVTPPSLEVRDKAAEAGVNQIYVGMGAKSLHKVIEEQGGNPDEVFRQIAEEKKAGEVATTAAPVDPTLGGGMVPDLAGGAPTVESLGCVEIDGEWYTPDAAQWVMEGRDYSKLTKKVITNRLGRKTTVYVRTAPKTSAAKQPKKATASGPDHLGEAKRLHSQAREYELAAADAKEEGDKSHARRFGAAAKALRTQADLHQQLHAAKELAKASQPKPASPPPPSTSKPKPLTREQQESEAHARDALRGAGRFTKQQVDDLEGHLNRLPRETLRQMAIDHSQAIGKTKADAARNLLAAVRRGHAAGEGLATGAPRQPAAKVEVHSWSDQAEAKATMTNLFGRDPEAGDVAAAASGVDGGTVTILPALGGKALDLTHTAPGTSASRLIRRDGRLRLVCDNLSFDNDKGVSGVSGAELMANQVKALRALGVTKMSTTAAGTAKRLAGGKSKYNGYYTWPRLGYDGPIPESLMTKLPPELKKHMGESNRLLRLFESDTGAKWWKENGRAVRLTFDLTDGSPNIKALERYLAGKRTQ